MIATIIVIHITKQYKATVINTLIRSPKEGKSDSYGGITKKFMEEGEFQRTGFLQGATKGSSFQIEGIVRAEGKAGKHGVCQGNGSNLSTIVTGRATLVERQGGKFLNHSEKWSNWQ